MGIVLKRELPFAYVVQQDRCSNICGHCLKIKSDFKRCSNCLSTYYCDAKCQKANWSTHKEECGFLKRSLGGDPSVRQICRLLLKIIKRDKKQVVSAFNGRTLNDLVSNSSEHVNRPVVQKMFALIVQSLESSDCLKKIPSVDELFELFCKTITNCIHIMTDEGVCVGVGLYVGLSELNHSCDPDAYYLFDGPVIYLRALKDNVTSYSPQLRIAYTDLLQFNTVRQKALKEQYCFTCDCRICNDKERDNEARSLRCSFCDKGYCSMTCDGTVAPCTLCHKQSDHDSSLALSLLDKIEQLNREYTWRVDVDEDYATDLYNKGMKIFSDINMPLCDLGLELLKRSIEQSKFREAEYYIENVLPCLRHFLPPGYPVISEKYFYAGKLHSLNDDNLALAEQRFIEAIDLLKDSHGANNPKVDEAAQTLFAIRQCRLQLQKEEDDL